MVNEDGRYYKDYSMYVPKFDFIHELTEYIQK